MLSEPSANVGGLPYSSEARENHPRRRSQGPFWFRHPGRFGTDSVTPFCRHQTISPQEVSNWARHLSSRLPKQ